MSPSRRLPRPPQPIGRPKVAGLRRPGPAPRPRPERARPADPAETTESTESTGVTGSTGATGSASATETETAEAAEAAEITEPAETPGDSESTETVAADDTEPAAARPAPRRKVRDTGRPKPVTEDDVPAGEPESVSDSADADGAGPDGERAFRRPGYGRVAALLVVGVLLAGLAVFFQVKHSEVSAQTENTALIDVAGTSEVKEAMSSAAESLFSIDYNDLGKTERAAADLLVNDEVKQKYDALMGEVKRLAPEQKIVVTVQATRSAVVTLDDDRAKVMVFIDQTATRASDNRSSAGGAALWFTTERRDGAWKVTDMDTYASAQPTPTPSPEPSGQAPAPQNGG